MDATVQITVPLVSFIVHGLTASWMAGAGSNPLPNSVQSSVYHIFQSKWKGSLYSCDVGPGISPSIGNAHADPATGSLVDVKDEEAEATSPRTIPRTTREGDFHPLYRC